MLIYCTAAAVNMIKLTHALKHTDITHINRCTGHYMLGLSEAACVVYRGGSTVVTEMDGVFMKLTLYIFLLWPSVALYTCSRLCVCVPPQYVTVGGLFVSCAAY